MPSVPSIAAAHHGPTPKYSQQIIDLDQVGDLDGSICRDICTG
jgi:hypothetical protein